MKYRIMIELESDAILPEIIEECYAFAESVGKHDRWMNVEVEGLESWNDRRGYP